MLSAKYSGNPHEKGVIRATASGLYDNNEEHGPMHALDPESPKFFWSDQMAGSWICINFLGRSLKATHYVLHVKTGSRQVCVWKGTASNTCSWNGTPKSWVIEGSNDGGSWVEIDRQTGRDSPSGVYEVKTTVSARMIRMRHTDKNGGGTHDFMLESIEFFGSLSGG
jgi:hypothetical protein